MTAPAIVNTSVNATQASDRGGDTQGAPQVRRQGTAQVGGEQGGRVHQVSPPQAGACT